MAEALPVPIEKIKVGEEYLRNSYHIGFCFFLVFLAFSAAQNYQTGDDHASDGAIALGILYGTFTFTNLIASWLISFIGLRLALVGGATTYVLFVAANIQFNRWALFLASGLEGIGAALLWTSQGAYVTKNATAFEISNNLPESSMMGYFNGLFFTFFQCNQFIGNLLVAVLFQFNISQWIIFVVLTILASIGVFNMLFLRTVPKLNRKVPISSDAPVSTEDALPQFHPLDALRLIGTLKFGLMIPFMFFAGLSQTYAFGEFTALVDSDTDKYYYMACFGFFDASSSYAFGKISDKIGRRPVLIIGFIANMAVYIFLMIWDVQQDWYWVFVLCAILLAIGDGVTNTQIYAILGTFFEKKSEVAFAAFKFVQAGATAIAYIYHSSVGFTVKSIITMGFLVGGMILVFIEDFFLWKLDSGASVSGDPTKSNPLIENGNENGFNHRDSNTYEHTSLNA